ncbi:MAG: hypothetical protein MJY74_03885 [Bacteroidaceae bacterium]|nr:hypothetical protein [Bacteroidaceae bacterium]
MYRRLTFFTLFFLLCLSMTGQDCPLQWLRYTSDAYIHAVESDVIPSDTSQTVIINSLIDRARLNVAKQLNVSISDKAKLTKQSLDGITSVSYSSTTTYTTEATMRLLRTDSHFQADKGEGFAIAYLDKNEVCGYWSKEAEKVIQNQGNELSKAERLISLGYKENAKPILEQLTKCYGDIDEPLTWLALCSYPEIQYQDLLDKFTTNVRKIDNALLSLGHGIAIFLDYHSDLFGEEYPTTVNQLSSKLASADRSFVDNPMEADWIVQINAKAREGQTTSTGAYTTFFAYVDVSLKIVKGSTAQVVYADSFYIKEGDTRGMKQAALAAFQKIESPLYDKINPNIKE